MVRQIGLGAVLVLLAMLSLLEGGTAWAGTHRLPDPGFFSPQRSPDGTRVLWESLERGGSIWLSDGTGGDAGFVVNGHSPSWASASTFRFVASQDDGHRLLSQDLHEYDLTTGTSKLVAAGSDNADYHTTLTSDWAGRTVYRSGALAGKIVCVDPGHGKSSGASSPISGKKEDHYVLIMSYLARDYLEAAGATVRMTRFDDGLLPGLQERVNFSNACGAQSFNAVHLNSASNVAARGLELYFRTRDAVSQAQARRLHDAMVGVTGIPSRGVRGDKETLGYTLAVLSDTHQMHNKTLSEACFLTNADDVALLEKTARLDQFAWGIYAGTARTLGVEPTPVTSTAVEATVESFGSAPLRRAGRAWIGGEPTLEAMETPEGDGSAAVIRNAGAPFVALRQGGAVWADYRVTATVSALDGAERYGLVARSNKCAREGNVLEGYLLVVDEAAQTASLKLSTGKPADAVTLASTVLVPTPGAPDTPGGRVWRTLELTCRGATITGSVDGVELVWPAPPPPAEPPPAEPPPADAPPADPPPPAPPRAELFEGKLGVLLESGGTARLAVDRFAVEPR